MDLMNIIRKPSFLTKALNPSTQSYSLEVLALTQKKLQSGNFKNMYSRYSYEGKRKSIVPRVKNKESLKAMELGMQYEYKIQSDTFV